VVYTKEDKELILKKWLDLITEFRQHYNEWENHTLAEHIKKCAEITHKRIQAKILDYEVWQIASFLYSELNKEGIVVSERHIRRVLPEHYKRKYIKSDIVAEEPVWQEIFHNKKVILEIDQFDHCKINGDLVAKIPQSKEESEQEPPEPKKKINFLNKRHMIYFDRVFRNCQLLRDIALDMLRKAEVLDDANEEKKELAKIVAKTIEDNVPDVEKLNREQLSIKARMKKTEKQSDMRNKIGEFEKLKAIMLWRAGHIHSHIAKVLSITPKHMSHNILKNRDKYINVLKWFGTITLKCNNCNENNTYKLSDWYEEQVARKSLNLDLKLPKEEQLQMEQPLLNN